VIKRVELDIGCAFFISPARKDQSIAEMTLKKLSTAMNNEQSIYHAAATAIAQHLPWRWVAITRFKSRNTLEVLAFLDNRQALQNYEYDLVGTPCENVFDTSRFTMFTDVGKAFPNYQALQALGAQTYAGLIFRGSDNTPLGHIMVMHDQRDVDFGLAEDVINMTTLALSSHFQLQSANLKLKEVEAKVKVDGLTNIGNRYAYESEISKITDSVAAGDDAPWTIAIIDLDSLKPLNDKRGHGAGDRFIKLMAIELAQIGRQGDLAFRIGGDEFALLFNHSSPTFIGVLTSRLKKAIERVRLNLDFYIDASMGCAFLYETKGDIDAWINLADQRMYQNKSDKKQSGDKK
jgi:diguanylate cyclase (GGDEF)-like protein